MKHIVVMGAGVIGLTSAYALLQAGHVVTLLEAADEVGQGSSFANGGQLSYRYVSPLADAGIPLKALGWMLRGEQAPLRLRLAMDPAQWRWLLAFMLACRRSVNRRNTAALLELAQLSQQVLREWREAGELGEFAWRANGKLVIHRQRQGFDTARRQLVDVQNQQVLSAAQCVQVEPALGELRGSLAGGILSSGDEVADCHLFCQRLLAQMQRSPHFQLRTGYCVRDWHRMGERLSAVSSENGEKMEADHFVLASGLASVPMLAKLKVRVPLYPLKGYSLSLPLLDQAGAPQMSVTDFDNKVVYARLDQRLRVAAMVDLVGYDLSLELGRLQAIRQLAEAAFPRAGNYQQAECWAGLRPATPTGVPLVGPGPLANLWLNIGHGALGFTLAAGSARRLAGFIVT